MTASRGSRYLSVMNRSGMQQPLPSGRSARGGSPSVMAEPVHLDYGQAGPLPVMMMLDAG